MRAHVKWLEAKIQSVNPCLSGELSNLSDVSVLSGRALHLQWKIISYKSQQLNLRRDRSIVRKLLATVRDRPQLCFKIWEKEKKTNSLSYDLISTCISLVAWGTKLCDIQWKVTVGLIGHKDYTSTHCRLIAIHDLFVHPYPPPQLNPMRDLDACNATRMHTQMHPDTRPVNCTFTSPFLCTLYISVSLYFSFCTLSTYLYVSYHFESPI